MLTARGLRDSPLFTVPESTLDEEGMLPTEAVADIRGWLDALSEDASARSKIVKQTLDGAVRSVARRTHDVADAAEEQMAMADRLRADVDTAYDTAVEKIDDASADGTLLRGEVLARWQEFVGTGELLKSLETQVGFVRDRVMGWVKGRPSQADKVTVAVESGLETLILDHAESAAERAHASWRSVAAGQHVLEDSGRELSRASRDFRARAERAVRDWQQDVLDMVRREGADKRSAARFLALGVNGLGLALMVVVFAQTAGLTGAEVGIAGGSAVLGQKLLEAVFGDQAVRRLATNAREDLNRRVRELLATERARYTELLDGLKISADDADRLRAASRRVDDVRFAAQLGEEAIT
jgi:hypothetical protein